MSKTLKRAKKRKTQMKKTSICALVLSIGLSSGLQSCIFYQIPSRLDTEKVRVNLNNGYTTEQSALNFLHQEANKLIGTNVKTNTGTYHVNNKREAIYRLCQLVDGIFTYEDSDYHVSLKELKEYIYKGHR
ncbi:hypothetical protein COV11_02840 [Candidatus Woesearchaeota archaeon CG10_big_fil_rev_8_21_14_0_10_30_7]|nr:MAG: hypothetical protein COV11_02840 [Candidatus Woesearchaeota archaeon CG10_big_fil_rev_8_21_14_0_10_30_7]